MSEERGYIPGRVRLYFCTENSGSAGCRHFARTNSGPPLSLARTAGGVRVGSTQLYDHTNFVFGLGWAVTIRAGYMNICISIDYAGYWL